MSVPVEAALTNMLIDAFVDQLDRYLRLIPGVPLEDMDDEAIAGLVRAGKLQDDPLITAITILIHPASEAFPEELYDPRRHKGFRLPSQYEIGGPVASFFFVKHLFVEFKLFYDNELERTIAQQKSQVVLARARHALYWLNARWRDFPRDTYGEKAHMLQIKSAFLREAGGPGTFIWKGRMRVQVLCDNEPADISGF